MFTDTRNRLSKTDHIFLHRLCFRCRALDVNVEAAGLQSRFPTPHYPTRRMEQIVKASKFCHLCSLMLDAIERGLPDDATLPNSKQMKIGLGHYVGQGNKMTISLEIKTNHPWTKRMDIGSISFVPYGCQYGSNFAHPSCLSMSTVTAKSFEYDAKIIKQWLHYCVSGHTECQTYQKRTTDSTQRPTRVLHIAQDHVKLRCNISSRDVYEYTTLSHVWGTDPAHQLSLTQANLLDLQAGVPISSLPTIYREAVALTKILGIQYLWIDSMCICQDSPKDWQREASKMATVYMNATCNLANPFPPNSSFVRQDPRSYLPCIVRPATSTKPGIYAARIISTNHDWNNMRQWPMSTRAWIMQEQILSPRTIYFGHNNLKWNCSRERLDEWTGKEQATHRKKGFLYVEQEAPRETFVQEPYFREPATLFVDLWENFIEEYRSTVLTKPGDRLIAFAGIARGVHNITKMTYLAGIWSDRIVHGLLWRVVKSTDREIKSSGNHVYEPVVHVVPSWSWFSIPIDSRVDFRFPITEFIRCCPSCKFTDVYMSSLSSFQWWLHPKDQLPATSYFDFQDLQLALQTQTMFTYIIWGNLGSSAPKMFKALSSQIGVLETKYNFFPDALERCEPGRVKVCLCLLAEINIEPESLPSWNKRMLAGLVLTPGPRRDTWTRRGMWTLEIKCTRQADLLRTTSSVFELLGGRDAEIVLV